MVLMFVVSIGFSQLYYWMRAEQRWHKLEQERIEQEKQADQAEKDAAKNSTTASVPNPPRPAAAHAASRNPSGSTGDAAIAVLMAVALPMLLTIVLSISYHLRKRLRRR